MIVCPPKSNVTPSVVSIVIPAKNPRKNGPSLPPAPVHDIITQKETDYEEIRLKMDCIDNERKYNNWIPG